MSANSDINFWKNKKVFVTGAKTFTGAWLCQKLLSLNAEVFAFGEVTSSIDKNPELPFEQNLFDLLGLGLKVRLTEGSLLDKELLAEALNFAQADIIIHSGESSSLRLDAQDASELIKKEVLGTANLMELLRETGSIRAAVVLSSDKVYARNSEQGAHKESDCVAAQEISVTAKLCSEFIATSYRHQFFNPQKYNKHKIAISTLRTCRPYGPGEFGGQSLFFDLVSAALKNEMLEIRNPNSVRPWLHIEDFLSGVLTLAQGLYEKGPKLEPVYNLFPTEVASVIDVAKLFEKAWGVQVGSLVQISENAKVQSFSLHNELSIEQIKKDLQWQPVVDLQVGVRETAQWYKAYLKS
ncbi:CDP-D-glucose-4,6-dehydratase [Bdellovibrio bacteriovorus W]|nr:CDP-D-glucose-4,6-dehydratase [Bdellovibrio bacteriovorus W]